MADVQLTCPACGRIQTVSEYVEEREMACPACGQAITLPERKSGKIGLQLKRREPPAPAAAPGAADQASGLPSLVAGRTAGAARNSRRIQAQTLKIGLNSLLFLVLAAGLAYIRFYNGLPGVPLETVKLYGLLAVAAAYLLIIILALRDNMFAGLLAIVVPFYPFYYLFFSSSVLFVRALVGALLVAFGYDTLLFVQAWSAGVVAAVNHWIQTV